MAVTEERRPHPVAPGSAPSDSGQGSDEASRALDRTLARGVAWLGVMRTFAQVVTWSSTILVARLLHADDYGIVSIAAIFVGIPGFFTEFGVARTIVLSRIRDETTVAQLHALCIGIGAAFALLLAAGAVPLARAYGEPRLAAVVLALALSPLAGGLAAVPQMRLQQAMDYRRIAALELVRSLSQTGTVLGLALAGVRYWALPAGILVASLVHMIASVRFGWLRPRRPEAGTLRAPLAYARHVIAGPLLWHVACHADFAVIGRVLDIAAVGFYQFAWNFASLPGEKITNVVQGAASPFFGSIGDDHAALRRYLLVVTESLAVIIVPVLAGFMCVAPDMIPVVFGAKWVPAVLPLQVLVAYALVQNLVVILNLVAGAAGLARLGTITGSVLVVVMPLLFWGAARWHGIVGVAAVWALVQPLLLVVPLLAARRRLGLAVRDYVGALRGPMIAAAVMVVAVAAVAWAMRGAPPVLRLVATIATGAAVYPAVLWVGFQDRLRALRTVWAAGRGSPALATA